MSLKRFSRPAGASIAVALVAVLLLGAVSTHPQWIGIGKRGGVVEQAAADVKRAQVNIAHALDSTDLQIKLVTHMIAWLEETEDAGSAEVVDGLSRVREHKWTPISLSTVLGLAATGELQQVSDATTRGRLLALDRRLNDARRIAEPEFELLRQLLEQRLTAGMWRFVFFGESGRYPIDYKAALRDLYDHGLQSTLRSLLRGLTAERAELNALSQETTELLLELGESQNRSVQP